MELDAHTLDLILHAEGKALATTGRYGLNVVPLSTVRIVEGKIWLMNYFLKKTLENIKAEPRVAFVCWRGLDGVQIKGSVEYLESGEKFEEAREWVRTNVANRTLKGLLILTPEKVYSVAPTAT